MPSCPTDFIVLDIERFGFPEWQTDGLVEDYAHYRRGEASAVSRTVQNVTGLSPRTFRDFADDYRHAFLN
jgi:hypothetical protein